MCNVENTTQAQNAAQPEMLLDLARAKFGTLSLAEKKLFELVSDDKIVQCDIEDGDLPASCIQQRIDCNWSLSRTIQANRLIWLCTNPTLKDKITFGGVNISGAKIVGYLDLNFAQINFPLFFIAVFLRTPSISNKQKYSD
jgi:hypothetical protein